jgi:hypothetical protein
VPVISHETVRQVLKKTNSNLTCGRCTWFHQNRVPNLYLTWKMF